MQPVRHWSKSIYAVAATALLAGGSLGCGGGGRDTGLLTVGVAIDVAAASYRLVGATFQVTGPTPVTLDGDEAGTAVAVQSDLDPGDYSILLADGWSIEREGAPLAASLTSDNPQMFSVVRSQISRVGFAFDADGTPLNFRQGSGGAADDDDF
jgi:hypothetical protein